MQELSYEYIRGVVEGSGTFTFSTSKKLKRKIPSLQIKMHHRDVGLLESIRDTMGLTNKIYVYDYSKKDGTNRNPQAMLIVREIGSLKNIVVPFFYNKLYGNKGDLFKDWLNRIGHDPWVPETYRIIYRLHRNGFYSRNPKFE